MQGIIETIYVYLAEYGLKVIGAVVIFIVGRWLARLLSNLVKNALGKANMDKTLTKFMGGLCYAAMLIFVIIAAA